MNNYPFLVLQPSNSQGQQVGLLGRIKLKREISNNMREVSNNTQNQDYIITKRN